MEKKFRLLLLLALLLTAATGAWAQTTYTVAGSSSAMFGSAWEPSNPANDMTKNSDGTYSITYTDVYLDGDVQYKVVENRDWGVAYPDGDNRVIKITEAGTYSFTIHFNPTTHEVYETKPGYTVSLKDGVKDADKWTITPKEGLSEGDQVTLTYTGRLKVKGVKATSDAAPAAPAANIVDLSKLTENTELKDGDVATGTLGGNYKITIADGATVTLSGAVINGVNDMNYKWAGITCLGDATIILSGTNTVNGFYEDYPGIQAAADKTLTINGTGSLTASSYGWGAGIGGVKEVACGNITISGGTVTATGGQFCAGIGGGNSASCGNITISGGTVIAIGGEYGAGIGGGSNASWGNITISGGTVTATGGERGAGIGGGRKGSSGSVTSGNILISGGTVTATGGDNAAGIGGGRGYNNGIYSSCGTITITTGVTKVTATMGEGSTNSIGAGKFGTCGTVTIGGNVGAITESPYTYQPSN